MICSVNEIGGVLRKAAMGSGYPVGLADAMSAAGVWLCAHDLDGVGAVLAALDTGFEPALDVEHGSEALTITNASIGRCGVSVFELLAAGEVARVVLEDPDSLTLLVGMAGVAAAAGPRAFAFHPSEGELVVVDRSGLSGRLDLAAGQVEIELVESRSQPASGAHGGVSIDEQHWHRVSVLAARIYVPATDASRLSGAGAGLTDND
jgi:hypothetical protein